MTLLKKYLADQQKIVDRSLQTLLPAASTVPQIIHQSMRYSVFAGGKRLRPILVMAASDLCGLNSKYVLPAACAMELIHTYSLVHDDLPAMDNDDYRRGRLTNHKVYGDDIAILAGDALLTHAFELLALNGLQNRLKPEHFSDLIKMATRGAGTFGMIGGQVMDISSDKGRWKKHRNPKHLLDYIHQNKTAALIQASLLVGATLAKAPHNQMNALKSYGEHIGLAFQIQDDILDLVGDKKKLGKKGSDRANQKLTYVTLYGLDKATKMAQKHIDLAHQSLRVFSKKADIFHQLADFIIQRDH